MIKQERSSAQTFRDDQSASAGPALPPSGRRLPRSNSERQAQLLAGGLAGPTGETKDFFAAVRAEASPSRLPFQEEMESAFGEDFSGLAVYLGAPASLGALGARAAACGEQVAFASAQPDREVVAHELVHVVQHRLSGATAIQCDGARLSAPGGAAETEAEAASARVRQGNDPGPIRARPVTISRDQETLSNIVEVKEEGGVCAVLGDDAEHLMDVFVADAQRMLDAWTDIREGTDLRFDERPLEDRFTRFQMDWMSLSSNNAGPGGSPISIANTPDALDELRRRMSSGTIPQYVQEIRVFNRWRLFSYAELLGLQDKPVRHRYQLLTTFAISGGAGEVLVGEVAIASYEIVYRNDLGMHWSQSTECIRGGGGVGISTSPVSVNVESSLGGSDINAGSADVGEYFGPDFFDAAVVGYLGAEAILGGGIAIGGMTFSDGDRILTFDTSGLIVRAGTDDVGAASATGGVGVCAHPTTSAGVQMGEVSPIEAAPREGAWTPLIEAALFFPTGSADLDAEDRETIAQVVRAILDHERRSAGDIFQLQIVGSASNRWRGSSGEGSGEEQNTALAVERASASRTALLTGLGMVRTEFTAGVMSQSTMQQLYRRSSSTDPDDNSQIDRSVYINVRYNPCGAGGNVTP